MQNSHLDKPGQPGTTENHHNQPITYQPITPTQNEELLQRILQRILHSTLPIAKLC